MNSAGEINPPPHTASKGALNLHTAFYQIGEERPIGIAGSYQPVGMYDSSFNVTWPAFV